MENPRVEELIALAQELRFAPPTYFDNSLPFEFTVETQQEFVRSHKTIATLRDVGFDYPNEIYWRRNAFMAAHGLDTAQRLIKEEHRSAEIPQAAKAFAEAEAAIAPYVSNELPGEFHFGRTKGAIKIKPSDQVVIVGGGVAISKLQETLSAVDQCLPIIADDDRSVHFAKKIGVGQNIHSAISMNFPHGLEAQCGSWRDWILGATLMLSDGSIVKSGSQAVKNVAGYDAHKLVVGSRGTLAVVLEVILKTFPLEALPKHQVEKRRSPVKQEPMRSKPSPLWIQRTKPSDFPSAVKGAGEHVFEIDWASSTFWADVPYEQELDRYPDDWVIRRYCREKNLEIKDPETIRLMKTAKSILDPINKFNPGAMGII